MARSIWGVDSAAAVTPALYDCVIENFGKPEFWGRYLTTIPNVNDGLTSEEINRLRGNGIRVMPIYNDFAEAVGYRSGEITAANAIFHARRLGFPTGVRVYANIENFFDVDEAWLRGWVDAFYPSGYKPGFYYDPIEGPFSEAYCAAIANNEQVKVQAVLWSAEPEPGVTTKNKRPQRFNPSKPPCDANVWAWQYGRDAEACPIDTNLVDRRLYDDMW